MIPTGVTQVVGGAMVVVSTSYLGGYLNTCGNGANNRQTYEAGKMNTYIGVGANINIGYAPGAAPTHDFNGEDFGPSWGGSSSTSTPIARPGMLNLENAIAGPPGGGERNIFISSDRYIDEKMFSIFFGVSGGVESSISATQVGMFNYRQSLSINS